MFQRSKNAKKRLVGSILINTSLSRWMRSINLIHLIDDAKCYETVSKMRWQSGVCCSKCKCDVSVIKRGKYENWLRVLCKFDAKFSKVGANWVLSELERRSFVKFQGVVIQIIQLIHCIYIISNVLMSCWS